MVALSPLDLPIRFLAQPLGLLDKLPPARNDLRRFVKLRSLQ